MMSTGEQTHVKKHHVANREQEMDYEYTLGDNRDKNQELGEEVVDMELIYCEHCQRSYTPARSLKLCQSLDANGVPKCLSLRTQKRKVFNSAKVCNTHFICHIIP